VTLRDGTIREPVCVVDAQSYIAVWGMWPDRDSGKRSIDMLEIVRIDDSPHRLPARFADELSRFGESGMGYCVFTVTFRFGRRRTYISGNLVDFINYPLGTSPKTVTAVEPHDRQVVGATPTPDYYWGLYGHGVPTWPVFVR
jgi:hypothetical protein